ncbi:MAG: response regulator [Lachnospiraceae bacterium]|nr:response regulator [Lachnospiraceae bacterium]
MLRAIICDDEIATYKIIKKLLKISNIPLEIVGTAQNGEEALALIQKECPDIIFMDVCMPYLNGFEVMSQIDCGKVIVITAYNSFENAQQALRTGAQDILQKPFDQKQLSASISRVIGWNFTPNETINSVLEYIHKHYNEKIDLSTFAKRYFCTESHFSRLFKKYMGVSTMTYIHNVRINKAIELLNKGESIQDVCEKVGYNNLNSFYKYFKQFTNDTPSSFSKGKIL